MEAFLSNLTLQQLSEFITSVGITIYLLAMAPWVLIVGMKTGWGFKKRETKD